MSESLAEAVSNLQYFCSEWLNPHDTDLDRIGIRLMDLDELLSEAKAALDGREAGDRKVTDENIIATIPARSVKPNAGYDLLQTLGLVQPIKRRL